MRSLVNYLRQVFCAHEWEREEREMHCTTPRVLMNGGEQNVRVSTTCTRCGYRRSYWKF